MTALRPALFEQFVLSRQVKIALFIWGVLSLVAMLAYPFAYDQVAFFLGGESIVKDGAIPYRDFLDTKPPVIFYLYGAASFLFGHNQWGIRLLDVAWQCVTAIVMYRLLVKHLGSDAVAYLATFLYVWQYATTGYWMTAQAESFSILPTLLIMKCVLELDDHRAFKLGLVSGIALAVIFLLKFTVILFFIGVIIYLIRYRFRSETIPYLIGTFITFVIAVGGYVFHLHYTGALANFVEGLRWVREYAAITPLFGVDTIGMEYNKLFPEFLLRTFSITLTAVGITGLIRIFTPKEMAVKPLLQLFVLCLVFALLGVLYERKFFPYHYTRAFVFFAPFVSVGLFATYGWLRKRRITPAIVIMLLVAAFFSPLMQVYTQTISWPLAVAMGKNREELVQRKVEDYFANEQRLTGEYLKQRVPANENIFLWGNSVGTYYFAEQRPKTLALTVTPFITNWTSQQWKDTLLTQLDRSKPMYIVVEQGDSRSYISGTTLDSYQHLRKWNALATFVDSRYSEETRIGHFILYRRRSL